MVLTPIYSQSLLDLRRRVYNLFLLLLPMKILKSFAFLFLLIFIVAPFVSAQYYGSGFWGGTERFIESLVQNIEPLLRALFGGSDWTGYLLFEKLLLFLLIAIISGIVLQNLPVFKDRTHKGILRLIAFIVAVLGVRGLNYIWINTILVQYQALFIVVAGIFPFMIYWYFVKDFDGVVRKAAWVFYAVIYFGLWATTTLDAYEEVYLWTALFALLYGLFLDTWVQQWIATQQMKKQFSRQTWSNIADINEQINKIAKQIREGMHPKPHEAEKQIKELMNVRKQLAGERHLI